MVRSATWLEHSSAVGWISRLLDEQRMPGIFGDDAGLDAVGRVGAAEQVLHEQVLAFGMGDEVVVAGRRNWPG